MSGNSTRCAGCRYLRRRCSEDCVLAPYFPPTHPDRFACVHKIFGASNVTRMLQQLPVDRRATAADSVAYEAYWRVRDPVYGCVGIISRLQREIQASERELAGTRALLALRAARLQGGGGAAAGVSGDGQPRRQGVLPDLHPPPPPHSAAADPRRH